MFLCTGKNETLLTIFGSSNCGVGGGCSSSLLSAMKVQWRCSLFFCSACAQTHACIHIYMCMVISLFVHDPCYLYIHLPNHNVLTKISGCLNCNHWQWPCSYRIGTACTAHWTLVCGYPVCVHVYSFCIRPIPIGRIPFPIFLATCKAYVCETIFVV